MILPKITRYFIVLLMTFIMTISWGYSSSAQLTLNSYISNPQLENSLPETPAWDLNKAKSCGKYWCSSVNLSGNKLFYQNTITVALPRNLDKSPQETIIDVEQRAKFVQNIFQDILDNIKKSNELGNIEVKNWRFWLLDDKKSTHPFTPIVEIGIENDQTVIYIAAKPELALPQQSIITVTKIDAKANGTTLANLAQTWRLEIKHSLSEAIWGLEMDVQRPFLRLKIISIIILTTLILLFVLQRIK